MKKKLHPSDSLEAFANLDFHRRERTGIPEAVLAEGKTHEQVASLMKKMVETAGVALATRVTPTGAEFVRKAIPAGYTVEYNEIARTFVASERNWKKGAKGGVIAILAAGTSDVPVAEEARVTAETMGCRTITFYDVGVAGIHRLVAPLREIGSEEIGAVVVVAGMEGALPTVVRGLVAVPVIGVPTSVGYGFGGRGEAALMTMLQSCAPGLTVVNIDNGFGAGATAALIANRLNSAATRRRPKRKKSENVS